MRAAGSFSTPLARQLGFRLPVRPAKGYSITVPLADGAARPRHPVIDEALHAAVVPLGDRLRVAGTAEFAGYDQTVVPQRIGNLRGLLERVYPELTVNESKVEPWTGLRPMTADGMPILGPAPTPNVYLNTGHGPLGWTMACGSGKAVAASVLGEEPEFDIGPFGYGRA